MTKFKLKKINILNVHQVFLIYAVMVTMASCAKDEQNFNLTADDISKKIFTSSNYPNGYENNSIHQWLLTSSTETTVVYIELLDCLIEFNDAKVDNCELDLLRVYDGNTTSDTKLYEGCCLPINTFSKFNSTRDTLLVEFETDATISTKGFRIQYYNSACCQLDEEAGMAIMMIVGIAVGAVVLISAVIASYCLYKKKCSKKTADKQSIAPSEDDIASASSSNQQSVFREKVNPKEEPKIVVEDLDSTHPPPKQTGGMINQENDERRIIGIEIPTTLPPGGAKALPPIAIANGGPSGSGANATHVGGGKLILPPAPFGAPLPPLSDLNLPKQLAKSPYGNNPRAPPRLPGLVVQTKIEANGFLAPVVP